MSDLESQRRALKPDSGMLVARGNGNEALTGELRAFAQRPECVAISLVLEARANKGEKYFTYRTFWPRASTALLEEGQRLQVWKKDGSKDYWHFTHLTWPFIRTSIALDDERRRLESERAPPSA